jgi:hypothetical protein
MLQSNRPATTVACCARPVAARARPPQAPPYLSSSSIKGSSPSLSPFFGHRRSSIAANCAFELPLPLSSKSFTVAVIDLAPNLPVQGVTPPHRNSHRRQKRLRRRHPTVSTQTHEAAKWNPRGPLLLVVAPPRCLIGGSTGTASAPWLSSARARLHRLREKGTGRTAHCWAGLQAGFGPLISFVFLISIPPFKFPEN